MHVEVHKNNVEPLHHRFLINICQWFSKFIICISELFTIILTMKSPLILVVNHMYEVYLIYGFFPETWMIRDLRIYNGKSWGVLNLVSFFYLKRDVCTTLTSVIRQRLLALIKVISRSITNSDRSFDCPIIYTIHYTILLIC